MVLLGYVNAFYSFVTVEEHFVIPEVCRLYHAEKKILNSVVYLYYGAHDGKFLMRSIVTAQ